MRKKTLMSVPSTLHFSVMAIWVLPSSSPKALSRVEDRSAVAVSVLVPSLRCTLTVGASPELYDSSSKTCTEETCESWRRCLAAALAALLSSNECGSRPGLNKSARLYAKYPTTPSNADRMTTRAMRLGLKMPRLCDGAGC